MPKFNLAQVLQEEQDNLSSVAPRFGKGFKVDLKLKDGQWENVEGGRLWTLGISSENAYSINLIFNEFYLPKGAEFYMYNDENTMLYGPYTFSDNRKNGRLSTDLIKGASITLELFEPTEVQGQTKISVERVVHGYVNMFEQSGSPGVIDTCHIDVNCPEGDPFKDQSDAVAMILTGYGERFGTGTLINNTGSTLKPYILTAFHNMDEGTKVIPRDLLLSQAEKDAAEDWVFRFQYKSPSCDGGDDFNFITYNGSTFRSGWAYTDFLLVEMDQVPNIHVNYAGWSRGTLPASSSVGLHHPRGNVMKLAKDFQAATSVAETALGPDLNFWQTTWELGRTEPGSSGSALFNQDGLIVGQLLGGKPAACGEPRRRSAYGKIDISWLGGGTADTRLSNWLDPINTGQLTKGMRKLIDIQVANPLVCDISASSPTTFSLTSNPTGATINWSVDSNLSIVSGQGTNSIAVKAVNSGYSGLGEVSVAITDTDGTVERSKSIWVGKPSAPIDDILGPISVDGSSVVIYNGSKADGATSYDWALPYPFQVVSYLSTADNWQMELTTTYQQLLAYTGMDENDGYVQLRGLNSCGYGGAKILWVDHSGILGGPGGGGQQQRSITTDDGILVYPNPATTSTTIELTAEGSTISNGLAPTQILGIRVLDSQMTERIVRFYKKGVKKTDISVSKLELGIYTIVVLTDAGTFTKKLMIDN
ncbi:T9SS type A sorting domain-containing protein [uncultured Roseivirga sp.]|uniref:T9SS type A sorting domain-containing protein n=1 Tax=uncultured Roseivirga sp. TaxID=543088 RepID=UPI0030DC6C32